MSWGHGEWSVPHALPLGVTDRAAPGTRVAAGDVIASGTQAGPAVRVACARRLRVDPSDVARVLRVAPGAEVERGTILARTGRRFVRAVAAPIDGRVIHLRADGDLELAPIVDRWVARSVMDGEVVASTDATVTVRGAAWALQGVAAYGADAVGEIALVADGPGDDAQAARIDVRQRGRILVGGGRATAEAIARAHACGAAAIVAGATGAAGLRALYGDDVGARGRAVRGDAPTVLCLLGFGAAALPAPLFAALAAFAGSRASVDVASARLFVFAAPRTLPAAPPAVALAADWSAVRPVTAAASAPGTRFPSEVVADAIATPDGPLPAANVRDLAPAGCADREDRPLP